MTLKYRIKLKNERVVGPLNLQEISDLFIQGHLKGSEDCQVFPVGEWRKLSTYKEIAEHLESVARELQKKVEETRQKTQAKTTTEIPKEKTSASIKQEVTKATQKIEQPKEEFHEFKFNRELAKIDIDYEELKRKHGEKIDEEANKTKIIKRKTVAPDEVEKTVVVNNWRQEAEEKKRLEEEKKQLEELKRQEEAKKLNQPELPIVHEEADQTEVGTQFLNLTQVLPTMNAELMLAEVELENERKLQENRARIEEERRQLQLHHQKIKEETEIAENAPKKRKGMKPIVAFAFLALIYMLWDNDTEVKKETMIYMPVKFPTALQYENAEEAKNLLAKGRLLYSENVYTKRVLAAQTFGASLANKFNGNDALGDLILVYAENMRNLKKPEVSNLEIYKLVQIAESKQLTDLNVVTGSVLFYKNLKKPVTGANIVKLYLKAGSSPSAKLLAYYLEALMESGDLVEARKIYERLLTIPKKSFEVYLSLLKFAESDDNKEKANELLQEGLKYYPKSVALLLKKADYLVREGNIVEQEKIVKEIALLNSEGSPYYTAKYLEHAGYLAVLKKMNKEAVKYFKKSLEIYESEELRTKLSSLEVSGDKYSQDLILESKIQELLKKAREEKNKQNWELAFSYTTEAIDANPNHIDAVLLQTEMQINRGHFEAAFYSLNRILQIYPANDRIKKNLVLAYIYSLKFTDAQRALAELGQSKFSVSDEYALLMAQYYESTNNSAQASRWYTEAIKRNALNDGAIYRLAKFYMRYKQFDLAKARITKAIELDPRNVNYRILYSEILYEKDTPEVAIGYLRDLMYDLGEDHRILSNIAIYYSRSGQIKEFEFYLKKVINQGKKDEDFYRYMIKLNKLNDNINEVVFNTNELLKLNPGDLMARMEFGEYLMSLRRYPEALDQFMDIKTKLASYPRVHFNMAKVYLITGDFKAAKANADKEFEMNPNLDTSLYIVGEVSRLMGNYSTAIEKLEKAIAINPKSVDTLMSLGWIKLKQNYYSEAFELYNRAFREDQNNPEIHKMLGYCYKASGQRALAKEKFEDYLKLSPGASDRSEIESLIRLLQ